jgi:MoxR-like ATPase
MAAQVVRRAKQGIEDHPLKEMVPDSYFGEQYISREIGGVVDLDIIEIARKRKFNLILEGPTGSAKTSLVYAAAAGATGKMKTVKEDGETYKVQTMEPSRRRPLVYVPCNGAIEPRQLLGGWVPQPDGSLDFVPGDLTMAVMYGGIIYLDEVNFTPPRIGVVLHGLLDKRRTITLLEIGRAHV